MTNLDLPAGHREHEGSTTKALNTVKSEAAFVRQAATEHSVSTGLLIGLVGLTAFLIGHAAGYRSAEAAYEPPLRRRLW